MSLLAAYAPSDEVLFVARVGGGVAAGMAYPTTLAFAGAKEAFLQGDDWAYTAGVVSIVLGAALVYFMFPRHDEEKPLLAAYHEQDTA